jgi:guanylate kinase
MRWHRHLADGDMGWKPMPLPPALNFISVMASKQFGRYGILFVISAPSGAGKTTLVEAFRQTPEFVYSVSCTTRLPRTGEIEGEDYHFLTESNFLARVKAGEFLEYAEVHEHYYGTLRKPVLSNLKNGVDVLIDIDTQGAAAIRNCDDEFVRQALTDVFIMPPNLEELRRRLTKRGTETPKQVELRLMNAAREMELWRDYRYTIISQSVEEDLEKFRHIMGAERYLSRRLIQK